MNLRQKSIEIILKNQSTYGSYIASPNFPTYAYSWFRDGTYIAYSMNLVGENQSAKSFYLWCANVINRQEDKIQLLIDKRKKGEYINANEGLTARYTLDGYPTGDDWTDFQLDGYGTWLWGLGEYIKHTQDKTFINEVKSAVVLTCEYLSMLWNHSCYDCWEEHLDGIHSYTLGSIIKGFQSIIPYASDFEIDMNDLSEIIKNISDYIENNMIHEDGFIRKSIFSNTDENALINMVDASLLGLIRPIGLDLKNNTILSNTLVKIEKDLYSQAGGVYRYIDDVYYGGGEWILLTAWLGWVYISKGNIDKAKKIKVYIESQVRDYGWLPEQVSDNLLHSEHYQPWVDKWGEIANPLLWSHAMYLILLEEINDYEKENKNST